MSDCLFCKIVEGSIPSKKVFENEHVLAFHDIQPAAPVHVLVIPKRHISGMNDVTAEDGEVMAQVLLAAQQVAQIMGISESGYRIINNCGSDGGQVVFHIHFHVLGGENLGPILAK